MPRSADPRGHDARVRNATIAFRRTAMTRRIVAPQRAGTASFPIRIARNVVPQIRHMLTKAAYCAVPRTSPARSGTGLFSIPRRLLGATGGVARAVRVRACARELSARDDQVLLPDRAL